MKKPKYLEIANEIERHIRSGVYQAGDKLPSVRKAALSRRVGTITIVTAYDVLIERELVLGRPRSGYTILPMVQKNATPHSPLKLPFKGAKGYISRVKEIVLTSREGGVAALGGASLAPELLPLDELRIRQMKLERKHFQEILSYEPWGGTSELRRMIARRSMLRGQTIDPTDCLVTTGGTQALWIALRTLLRPGDTVAVESPTYFGLLWMLEEMGIKILEIPSTSETGVRIDLLESVLKKSNIKAAVIHPNFQNPLGSLMPDESKERLAKLAHRLQTPLIEADTTSELFFETTQPRSIQSYDQSGWVLSYGSYSKVLAPGFRIGYLIPGRFMERAQEVMRSVSLASPTGQQLTIAKFIRDGGYDRHLRKLRSFLQMHVPRVLTAASIAFPPTVRMTRPRGGYLLWVELPKQTDSIKIWSRAREKGIRIAPGLLFSVTRRYSNYFRINCAVPWDVNTQTALRTLGQIINEETTSA